MAKPDDPTPLFGCMKGTITWLTDDPTASALDPDWGEQWDANNPPELYRRSCATRGDRDFDRFGDRSK
jgi:hypothetical protein